METFTYVVHQETHTVSIQRQGKRWNLEINGESYPIEIVHADESTLTLRFGSQIKTFYTAAEGGKRWVAYEGCTYLVEKPSARTRQKQIDPDTEKKLRAPMPAQVREVLVRTGEEVEEGTTLLLLEAMKMEIRVQAPRQGKLANVFVRAGETVESGQILVEFED